MAVMLGRHASAGWLECSAGFCKRVIDCSVYTGRGVPGIKLLVILFKKLSHVNSAFISNGISRHLTMDFFSTLDSIRVVVPTPPTTTIHNELGALHTCVGGPAELYMKPRCIRVIRISCTDVSCVGMTAIFKLQTDCTHAVRARASFRISLVGVVCSHS